MSENLTQNKKKIKKHSSLGNIQLVKVIPTTINGKRTSIFASVNAYTAEFQPRTPVELPEKVVDMLKKEAVAPVHVFKANKTSENGNAGAHVTEWEPKYEVVIIKETIEEEEKKEATEETLIK